MPASYLTRLNEPIEPWTCPSYIALPPGITVGEARSRISAQRLNPASELSRTKAAYRYMVDKDGTLMAVIPMSAMADSHDPVPIEAIAISGTKLRTVPVGTLLSDAMETFVVSGLRALPVVDEDGRIVGVLALDTIRGTDSIVGSDELRAEMKQVLAFDEAKMRFAGFAQMLLLRGPWLLFTLIAGVLCAIAFEHHSQRLAAVAMFVAFVPLVLALGDAICHQATQVVAVQSLHLGSSARNLGKRVLLEAAVSIILGLAAAVIVAVFALGYFRDPTLAVMLAFAIAQAMLYGGIIGFTVPVVIQKIKLDPHGAGGPVSLGLADIASTGGMIFTACIALG